MDTRAFTEPAVPPHAGVSLATELSRFSLDHGWDQLPASVQDAARHRLLDALSTAVASRAIPVTRAASAAVSSGSLGGACSVLPSGLTATAQDAAFINGVAVHALLYEDINLSSADHPGAVIVPAALAAAESSEEAAGRPVDTHELLAAIAVGYEVQLYLGAIAAQGIMKRGFRTTSVLGSVGAAAAVARLYRLSRDQTATAIALGANMSCGLLEAWSHGTEEPFLHSGFAARNGVLAGLLALAGTVAATTTLDGVNGFLRAFGDVESETLEELAFDWRIHGVLCKPYPISGAKLTAVDSALHALGQGVDTARIELVTVRVPPLTKEFPGGDRVGPFETMTQAQDSTTFCVSAALLGRPMASVQTYVDGFADPEVSQLSQLVQVIGEEGRELARVEILLNDGRQIVGEIDQREHHTPTISRMATKLRLLADAWPSGTADEVIAIVCGPDASPVGELSSLLRGWNPR